MSISRASAWSWRPDSGWWATYEDQVEGPLRTYNTTHEISGFQAIITGALTTLCPLEPTDALVNRIVEPLLQLFANDKPALQQSPHLIKRD